MSAKRQRLIRGGRNNVSVNPVVWPKVVLARSPVHEFGEEDDYQQRREHRDAIAIEQEGKPGKDPQHECAEDGDAGQTGRLRRANAAREERSADEKVVARPMAITIKKY